jgi:hypothetical protein
MQKGPIGLLWATGQLWWIRRRRAGEPAKSIRSALSQLGSKIELKIETAEPQVFSLDDAALERAQQHVASGGTIDEACALVAPRSDERGHEGGPAQGGRSRARRPPLRLIRIAIRRFAAGGTASRLITSSTRVQTPYVRAVR